MNYKVIALAIFMLLIYSCAAKKSVPTTIETKKSEPIVSTKTITKVSPEIVEGKELYENNCAKCHNLHETSEFSAEEWKPIVARMQKKAHLEDFQAQLIYNYVVMK